MRQAFERSGPLSGTARVPGDKSISHRAALVGAMSGGRWTISGYSPSADCARTIEALRSLGVGVAAERGLLVVDGVGVGAFRQPASTVDAGNSGTTMRLLAGAVASSPVTVTLTGDESLRLRPMGRIIEPLERMGARLEAGEPGGRPPITVTGGELVGIEYAPPVASAQVKSAVLLAGLGARGKTTVREVAATRDHTERMLELAGVTVSRSGLEVSVEPGTPRPARVDVPGDISSAAFIIAAALLLPGSRVTVSSVGLNPTRTGFLEVLERMGAELEVEPWAGGEQEPRGSVSARGSELRAIEMTPEEVATCIDEVPLLAMVATAAEGRTVIRGAGELRKKESDRVDGTVAGLRALGASIEQEGDGMVVEGPVELRGARVSSRGDHRLAMMLAVAGLTAGGRTVVEGWEWTAVSYPGFEGAMAALGAEVV